MARIKTEDPISHLEEAMRSSIEIFDRIEPHLKAAPTETSASEWLKRIAAVRARYKTSQTLIGLLGSTGAGKSSLVNAVLGEEQ